MKKKFIINEKTITLDNFSNVMVYECEFSTDHYSDNLFSQYDIQFPDAIKNSAKKRKSEFFAGRYVSKITLQKLESNSLQVDRGKHGKPIWSAGIKGSITHTNNFALCAVSDKREVLNIGIDRENWLSQRLATDLNSQILSKSEHDYLLGLCMPFNKLLTIIFSAKESLFKALYPFVEQYFDFTDVSVVSITFSANQGRFTFKLHSSIFKNYADDYVEGLFYIDDDFVTTVIVL